MKGLTMDVQKECLEELTKAVCKSINRINEALEEKDEKRRSKVAARVLKELEIVNDEAMRSGLGLTVYQMMNIKTRKHGASKKKGSEPSGPRELSPHQQLMDHHAKHVVGPIPDGGAQGAAVKWILQHFTPELAIKRYNDQLAEGRIRRVSWLTVKQDIGRIQTNGTRPTDGAERNAERLNGNLELVQELRGETGGDNHEVERGPSTVH